MRDLEKGSIWGVYKVQGLEVEGVFFFLRAACSKDVVLYRVQALNMRSPVFITTLE